MAKKRTRSEHYWEKEEEWEGTLRGALLIRVAWTSGIWSFIRTSLKGAAGAEGGERTPISKGRRLFFFFFKSIGFRIWIYVTYLCYLRGLENPRLRNSSQYFWVGSIKGLAEVNTNTLWKNDALNPLIKSSGVWANKRLLNIQRNKPRWVRATLKWIVVCHLFHPFIHSFQVFMHHSLYTRYYFQQNISHGEWESGLDQRIWYIWLRALSHCQKTLVLGWCQFENCWFVLVPLFYKKKDLRSQWSNNLPRIWTSVSLSVEWG